MSEKLYFDRPSYTCDEGAWVRALDYAVHAETVKTFKARLADWLPFFPDAAAVLDAMSDDRFADYEEFRRGLQSEREGVFAGEAWASRFGAVLMPENAIRASIASAHFAAPWGAALIRIAESESSGRSRQGEAR